LRPDANRPYSRAIVVASLLYAHQVLGEAIEPFIVGYARGAELAPGSPAVTLRTYVGERMRPSEDRDRVLALKVLRCALGHVREATMERSLPSEEGYDYLARIEAQRVAGQAMTSS
jgi:hypothetical protein